uniref:Alcohol dehydrogenase n=1 Tax=Anaerobacillus isosaccharinicus TaxID=1532552 RepID=A0A1S2LDG4_9BACI|nr:iron-containing alcohol dehydrogenase [Anaerobacillus isosaccharinicus]QOY38380.1 iron-containing alcohol dehydrogenase [Anaerobacillus isosaccharinicus]
MKLRKEGLRLNTFSSLKMPETIFYGRGSFETVGKEAASRGKKALIISDPIMNDLGYIDQCIQFLNAYKVNHAIYLDIKSEPIDIYVDESLKLFTEEACDLIISLGGGSCIDTAKAVAIVATNGGYIGDYMGGNKLADKKAVPHISIPTTAGTGSEVSDVTVITNTKSDVKMMIKQPAFIPSVAIVDPILTVSSPKSVTAATGVDALSHAVEAFLSKKAHPMTDVLALSAMDLIVNNIRSAYANGEDLNAREAMALGSMQAGIAFSNSSVCLVHGMSRPIGALFHVPHGVSNAMLLPAVLEFSQAECIDQLAKLGEIFSKKTTLSNVESALLAVEEVKKLCLDLDIPNLKLWGIDEEVFSQVIDKMASDALASGSPRNNPRVPTKEEIVELYKVCFNFQFSGNETLDRKGETV